MKKLSQTSNNAVSFVNKNTSFDKIKVLVLSLPIQDRLKLYYETSIIDWKERMQYILAKGAQELKKKGIKQKDILRIIQEVRSGK